MDELQPQSEQTPGLGDYIRALRERYWVILAVVIVITGAAVFVSLTTTPLYKTSAGLVYQTAGLDTGFLGTQLFLTDSTPVRVLDTAATVLKDNLSIAEAVKQELGSKRSASGLLKMIVVSTDPNNNLMTISAVSPYPDEAAKVANAFSEQFIAYSTKNDEAPIAAAAAAVKQQLDALSPADLSSQNGLALKEKYQNLEILASVQHGGFSPASKAIVPTAAFTPRTAHNTMLGLVVGLVLGVGLALVLEYFDKRIKDDKTLGQELGVPVLTSIPRFAEAWAKDEKPRSTKLVGFSAHPPLLEPFRTLRSRLQYPNVDSKKPVWLITSAVPREGRSATAVNLALSLSMSGKRVVLLEADLRHPMIQSYLGLGSETGLSDVLAGTRSVAEVLQLVRADDFLPPSYRRQLGIDTPNLLQRNVYAMTAGPIPPNPPELLGSERMGEVIAELKEIADCVVIDTPPVLSVSDALVLLPHVQGILIVARLRSTTRQEARQMRDIMERAQAPVLGAVADGAKPSPDFRRRRGYGDYCEFGYSSHTSQ